MNPDLIDGIKDPRDDSWSRNNAKLALRAEAIVKRLDPGRIVYHHSSGNLGSMHTINFYLNFVPIQEMSDWFEHWATQGRQAGLPVRVRRAVHLGLDDVPRLVQGPARMGQRAGAVGVLPRRVERPVPRRPGLPDQRGGEEEPPLGGRSSSGPATSGTAGITRTRSGRATSTTGRRSSPATSPTTGAPIAPGGSPRIRRGNTRPSGSCATAWTGAARS